VFPRKFVRICMVCVLCAPGFLVHISFLWVELCFWDSLARNKHTNYSETELSLHGNHQDMY
jgi:hypothetical protein